MAIIDVPQNQPADAGDVTNEFTSRARVRIIRNPRQFLLATDCGIYSYNDTGATTLILHNNVTLSAHANNACGVYYVRTPGVIVTNQERDTLISVSNSGSRNPIRSYGLYAENGGMTIGGTAGETFRTAVKVSARSSGWSYQAFAYGFSAKTNLAVIANLAGKVSVSATSYLTRTTAVGLYAGSALTLNTASGDITATASGKSENGAEAYGLQSGTTLTVTGRLANKITAKASGESSGYREIDGIWAAGFKAGTDLKIEGGLAGTITATANSVWTFSKEDVGTAYADGLQGYTISIKNGIGGKISATSKIVNGSAYASGLRASVGALTVEGDITGTISTSATASRYASFATCLRAKSALTVEDRIGGTLSVKANTTKNQNTNNGNSRAYALYSATGAITLKKELAGKITAVVSGANETTSAIAFASEDISVQGKILSKLEARASSTKSAANACGLYSQNGVISVNSIENDFTATAKAGSYQATAMIFSAQNGITVSGAITGKLTATAKGAFSAYAYIFDTENAGSVATGDLLNKLTASASGSTVGHAYLVNARHDITIGDLAGDTKVSGKGFDRGRAGGLITQGRLTAGDITGKITVTGTAGTIRVNTDTQAHAVSAQNGVTLNSLQNAVAVKASGAEESTAAGVDSTLGNVSIASCVSGDLKVSATGYAVAQAQGIRAGTALELGGITGKTTVSATARGKAEAYGLQSATAFKTGEIAGKITVKSTSLTKLATAYCIRAQVAAGATAEIAGMHEDMNASASGAATQTNATILFFTGKELRVTDGITGNLNAAVKNKAGLLKAYGLAGTKDAGDILTIAGGISGDIKATAAGSGGGGEKATASSLAFGYIAVTGEISGRLTASAKMINGSASAVCINAVTGTLNTEGISGDIKATSTAAVGDSHAMGIYSAGALSVTGDLAGKIAVSAKNTVTGMSIVCGIGSNSSSVTLKNILNSVSVAANGKNESKAYAIQGSSITVQNDISGAISAKAVSTNDSVNASCIVTGKGRGAVKLEAINNAMTATATTPKGKASAYGIYAGTGVTTGEINGKITISATAKNGDACAYAIRSEAGPVKIGGLNRTLSVKAFAAGREDISEGTAQAAAFEGTAARIDGNVTAKISVQAESVYNAADAYGIYANGGNAVLTGNMLSSVSVTATAGRDKYTKIPRAANAAGIFAAGLELRADAAQAGTWSVKASSKTLLSSASGWNLSGALRIQNSMSVKMSVTATHGSARGICAGGGVQQGSWSGETFTNGGGRAEMTLNLAVTGRDQAVALELGNAAKIKLSDSKLSAKVTDKLAGNAWSVLGSASVQDIELEGNTALIGNVSLDGGNDRLELGRGSKITGKVDFGAGTDTLRLNAGSKLSGSLANVEKIEFAILDDTAPKTAMLELDSFDTLASGSAELDLASGLTGTYTLAVDKNKNLSTCGLFDSVALQIDGVNAGTLSSGGTVIYDGCSYKLSTDRTDSKLLLAIAKA